jgi:hypothetical protein
MSVRTLFPVLSTLMASPLAAQATGPTPDQPNLLLRSAGIFLGVVVIWVVLYKAVYPYFLQHYRDDYCKTIFWNLFSLYTLTWLFVSFYVVLDIGFYWAWLPWVALFIAVWWLIAGTVLLLRRVPA